MLDEQVRRGREEQSANVRAKPTTPRTSAPWRRR